MRATWHAYHPSPIVPSKIRRYTANRIGLLHVILISPPAHLLFSSHWKTKIPNAKAHAFTIILPLSQILENPNSPPLTSPLSGNLTFSLVHEVIMKQHSYAIDDNTLTCIFCPMGCFLFPIFSWEPPDFHGLIGRGSERWWVFANYGCHQLTPFTHLERVPKTLIQSLPTKFGSFFRLQKPISIVLCGPIS